MLANASESTPDFSAVETPSTGRTYGRSFSPPSKSTRVPAARVDVGPKRARRARRVPGQTRLTWPRGGARFRTRGRKSARVFPAQPRGAPRLVEHRRVAFEHVAVARPAVRAQSHARVRAHAARRGERNRRERAAGGPSGLLWPSLAFSPASPVFSAVPTDAVPSDAASSSGEEVSSGVSKGPQRRRSRSALEIAPLELAPHRDLLLLLLELGVQAAPSRRGCATSLSGAISVLAAARCAARCGSAWPARLWIQFMLTGACATRSTVTFSTSATAPMPMNAIAVSTRYDTYSPSANRRRYLPRALSTGHRPGAPARVPEQTRLLRRRRLRRRRRRRGGRKADALRARHPVSRLVQCGERASARLRSIPEGCSAEAEPRFSSENSENQSLNS